MVTLYNTAYLVLIVVTVKSTKPMSVNQMKILIAVMMNVKLMWQKTLVALETKVLMVESHDLQSILSHLVC